MININIENRLKEIIISNPEYDGLWSTWNLNKKIMQPILNAIIKDYPHYSLHDDSHSDSILSNVERLLGSERIKMLSPTDLWLMLHVAYLHDFGMVITDPKMTDIWKSAEFQEFIQEQQKGNDEDAKKAANIILNIRNILENTCDTWPIDIKKAVTLLLSKYCRRYHASISKDYIIDKDIWSLDLGHNGLVKKRLISLIGEISILHTKPFDDILKLPKTSNGFKNDYVHPRFVACMLRVGDVLDLDNGRFNEYTEQIFGAFPEESYNHYKKHESTKHVLITPESIEVEADCHDSAVYRETRKWFDSLKQEIENLHLQWNDIAPDDFGRPPKLSSCKLLRDGIPDIHGLSELKLHISQSKALEILEGSSIYKSKFACIRELIQNAEDASKIQLWRDINRGIYYCNHGIDKNKVTTNTLTPFDIPSWIYDIYSITVNIEKTKENNVLVTILDHGTGISIESLRSICNIGQSYFIKKDLKDEIKHMPVWLKPTASFGIGLQSCFIATNKFTITSKSDFSEAMKIVFESGKEEGYVNAEIIQNENFRGSKVSIEFDGDMPFSYNMFGFTARNIRNIDPFGTSCVLIYRIIEEVISECGNSFFNIDICSKEIKYNEKINSYFTEIPSIDSKELLYFDRDKAELNMWYDHSFYNIKFCNTGGIFNVYFKGKIVNKTRYLPSASFIGLDITVDIYGMQTKEAISLNRDELSNYACQKVYEDLQVVIRKYLEFVLQIIEKGQNYKFAMSYVLCAWMYEMEIPTSINSEDLDQNISVLERNENKYEIKCVSFKDIYKEYPKIPFIKEDIVKQCLENYSAITEERLLTDINSNFTDIHERYIIIDKGLCDYLKWGYSKSQYLRNSNIRIRTVNHGDAYIPDDYTRHELIKQLVFDDKRTTKNNFCIERRSIPAIKDYEQIAVSINIPFVYSETNSKWGIISPISYNDATKISGLSCEEFIDYIINRPTFANLVEYTLKNAMIKNTSRETIISNYKKLIVEYYNLVKE